MANQNMKALIEFTVNQMKDAFTNSKKIFEDNRAKNNLIHSSEFGAFRERIVAQFLKLILPPTHEIGTGFIITPNNEHSTQCDILIYDKDSTTLFTDQANARLFPVETIVGFCEVKSNITSFADFKNIIDKMHTITKLRHNMDIIPSIDPSASKTRVNLDGRNVFKMLDDFFTQNPDGVLDNKCLDSMYYDKEKIEHGMTSLLICNKIEVTDLIKTIDRLNQHCREIDYAPCAILSLQDGVILNRNNKNDFVPYFFKSPIPRLKKIVILLWLESFNHREINLFLFETSFKILPLETEGVMKFINIVRQAVINTKTFEFDIVKYAQDDFR